MSGLSMLVGVDWNRDGIIFWKDEAKAGTHLSVNGVDSAGVLTGATITSNTATSSGFSLSWNATAGAVRYIVHYDGRALASTTNTTYSKTYDAVELMENITPYVMSANISTGYSTPNATFPAEGTATFDLLNTERIFSPAYTSSFLQNSEAVIIGSRVDIMLVNNDYTIYRQLWQGFVENIRPKTTLRSPYTQLTAIEGIVYLRNYPQPLGLMTDKYSGEVVEELLREFIPGNFTGWMVGRDALGTGTSVTDYHTNCSYATGSFLHDVFNETWLTETDRQDQIKSGNTNVQSLVENITVLENGIFVIKNGYIYFLDKSAIAQLSLTAANFSIDTSAMAANYEYGEDIGIFNIIKVNYYAKEYRVNSLMFSQDEDDRVVRSNDRTGEAQVITVSVPASSNYKITPLAITDYDITYTGGTLYPTVTINEAGTGIEFSLIAAGDCTITKFTVTGDFLVSFDPVEIVVQDDESIVLYGKREKSYDFKECASLQMATTFANSMLMYYRSPRGRFSSISLNDKDSTWDNFIDSTELLTPLNISEYQTGETGLSGIVVGLDYQWTPGLFQATYIIREQISEYFWVLSTSELENETVLI